MSPRARRQPPTTASTASDSNTMVAPSTAASTESRTDRIAQRAYALYERRSGQGGSEVDDWLQAEREIDSEV